MRFLDRGLLFVAFIFYFALDLFLGSKPASVFDVALFSWLAYCALAEKLESMK